MLSNLTYRYLTGITRGDGNLGGDFADLDFSQSDAYSSICENPHIRLSLVLEPSTMRNTELHTSIVGIFNRTDAISYYDNGSYYNSGRYLSFTSYGHEVAFETSLLKSANLFKTFYLYGGLGTNLGYTFGNELHINGSDTRTVRDIGLAEAEAFVSELSSDENYHYNFYDQSDGISQRAFAQVGASIVFFRRLEIGLEGRFGLGYRAHFNGPMARTNLRSLGATAKWVLK